MLPRYIFTAEIALTVDAVGTVQTRHYATEGFASRATDTPPSTWFDPRLADPGTLRRELFSGARVSGAVRPGFGRLVLANADGALDAWLGYGVSGNRVVVRYGPITGAYPIDFVTVYTAYADTLDVDFAEVRILLRDRTHLLDQQIVTTRFAGTGGEEGSAIAAGLKRQMVIGKPGYIPLQLIDEDARVFHVHSTPTDIDALNGSDRPVGYLFEGGIERVHTGYVTSYAALTGAALAADQAKLLADYPHWPAELAGVYVRLGADAQYDLRFGAIGHALDEATETVRAWTFTDLVNRAGLTDVSPATAAAPPGSINPTAGNRLIGGDETYLDAMNDRAASVFAAFGFDRLDRWWCLALHDPSEVVGAGDTIKFEFTEHHGSAWRRLPVPGMEAPVWQVAVNAGTTWPCSVATTATTQNREFFTRGPHLTQFTGTSDSTRLANPGAKTTSVQIIGNEFQSREDQVAFIERYIRLYGTRRDYITFTCHQFDASTLALDLHDRVSVRMPRMQCAAGRTFRIVTIALNLRARTIDFGLWGGVIGPDDAVLGGGDLYLPGPTPGLPVSTLAKFGRLPPFEHLMRGSFVAPPPSASGTLELLLHFNGVNGSTVFTDSSPASRTISQDGTGNAAITTGVGLYGGACVTVAAAGGNDHWITALAIGPNLRPFAMGGWFRLVLGGNTTVIRISTGVDSFAVDVTLDGITTYIGDSDPGVTHVTGFLGAADTWIHWFVSRDAGGVIRAALGGVFGATTRTHAGAIGTAGADTTELCFCSDVDARFDDFFIVFDDSIHVANFTPPAAEFSYP